MKMFNKTISIIAGFSIVMSATILCVTAATSPSLGEANSFAILASTYTNTVMGTIITGDIGYTTGPAEVPIVIGSTFVGGSIYNAAGADQGTALASLNGQACTFSFSAGAIDLATDSSHGMTGVYEPGVYCIDGAATIGTAGMILSGVGTYIFRVNGALNTVDNSVVMLSNGSSACNVWWTPSAATTLGADTTFVGTIIDDAGITIGNIAGWVGRALSFGGTITTSRNTITVPTCSVSSSSSNGGAASSIQSDICLNGDNSPSNYDHSCNKSLQQEVMPDILVNQILTNAPENGEPFAFGNPGVLTPQPLLVALPITLPNTGSDWESSAILREVLLAISILVVPCVLYMMPRRRHIR